MIDRFGLLPAPVKNLISITELKIHAAAMGINKIDVGDKGGRLLFTDNPDINPVNIIKLIQEKPDIYKLDGKNKLRFYMSLEDNDKRFHAVVELLELLQAA